MAYAVRPLNPVVILGVSGDTTEAPKLSARYSVMQWWKAPRVFSPSEFVNPRQQGEAPAAHQ